MHPSRYLVKTLGGNKTNHYHPGRHYVLRDANIIRFWRIN